MRYFIAWALTIVVGGGIAGAATGTIALALTAPFVYKQQPSLKLLPTKADCDVGDLLKVQAETTGKRILWRLAGPVGARMEPDSSGKWVLFAASKPGIYVIQAVTAAADEPSEIAECIITVKGVGTDPKVDPVVVKGVKAHVIVIVDQAQPNAQLTALLNGPVSGQLKAKGHFWHVLDVKSPSVAEKKYGPLIQAAGGVPCIIFVYTDGRKSESSQLPIAADDVLKLVKEKTGL